MPALARLGSDSGRSRSSSSQSSRSAATLSRASSSSARTSNTSQADDLSHDDIASEDEDYDFSLHDRLKRRLDAFLRQEGRVGLEHCDRLGTPFVGLANQGATCYLNSLVQSLFHCAEFRQRVFDWDPSAVDEERRGAPEDSIPLQLQRLFARLQFAEQPAISTKALTNSFGWSDMDAFEQQDVQELCRVLFDSLEKYGDPGKNLTRAFKGSLVDYIVCLKCGHKRAKREEFQDISLVVHETGNVAQALNKFVEVERLDGDNQYFCEHCSAKVDAIKGHRLMALPPVLFLHMKRFQFDWEAERRIKLQESVEIPMGLDLSGLVGLDAVGPQSGTAAAAAQDPLDDDACEHSFSESLERDLETAHVTQAHPAYVLSAVLVHSGNANSGHYFAIVRTGADTWHEFNDVHVSELSQADVERMCGRGGTLAEGGAYMLMYSQLQDRSERAPTAASVVPPPQLMEWIQAENDLRSKLRRVSRMDRQLLRFTVIRGPAVTRDAAREVVPSQRESVALQLNGAKATVLDLKHRAYNRLVPKSYQSRLPLSSCRLRKLFEGENRLGEAYDDAELEGGTINDLGISHHVPLLLEFLRPSEDSFEPYLPEEFQFRVFFWDSALRAPKPANAGFAFDSAKPTLLMDTMYCRQTSMPCVRCVSGQPGRESPSLADLKHALERLLGVPAAEQGLIRHAELARYQAPDGVVASLQGDSEAHAQDTAFALRMEDEEASLVEHYGLASGDGILLTVNGAHGPAAVLEEIREARSFLTVLFNDPHAPSKTGPVRYDFSVKASREATLDELKALMLAALPPSSVSADGPAAYHLRRSAKAAQLKDGGVTLDEAGLSDQSVLHLAEGAPVPKGHTMLRILERAPAAKAGFKLRFRLVVDEQVTVAELRAKVAAKLGLCDAQRVVLFDKVPRVAPREPLKDGRSLRSALRRLEDGKTIVADVLDESESAPACVEPVPETFSVAFVRLEHEQGSSDLRVAEASQRVVQSSWTLGQLGSAMCPGFAVVPVAAEAKGESGWLKNAAALAWCDPLSSDVRQAAAARHVISKAPLRMRSGALLLYTRPTNVQTPLRIAVEVAADLWSAATDGSGKVAGAERRPGAGQEDDFWAGATLPKDEGIKIGSFAQVIGWEGEERPTSDSTTTAAAAAAAATTTTPVEEEEEDPVENGGSQCGEQSPLSPDGGEEGQGDKLAKGSLPTLQRVPSLDLSSIPAESRRTSYQEEFMAKQDEWSESWREAAAATGELPRSSSASKKTRAKPSRQACDTPGFQPGDRVLAKAEHWKRFFPGTVFSKDCATGTYAIDFDDGDRLEDVAEDRMRAGPAPPRRPGSGSAGSSRLVSEVLSPSSGPRRRPGSGSAGSSRQANKVLSPTLRPESSRQIAAGDDASPLDIDSEDLCPTDKRERRAEKLASRGLRLQLMYMEEESSGKAEAAPATSPTKRAPAERERAKSSPTRSRTRTYVDGEVKQRRVVSSKVHRPGALEPLQVPRGAESRIPRLRELEQLEPIDGSLRKPGSRPTGSGGVGRSFIPSPSSQTPQTPQTQAFHHSGRKLQQPGPDERVERTHGRQRQGGEDQVKRSRSSLPPLNPPGTPS